MEYKFLVITYQYSILAILGDPGVASRDDSGEGLL